jgi:hypothetical protein
VDGRWDTNTTVPAGSTPVWKDYFLTSDNRLVTFDGNQVGTNISKVGQVDRYTGSGTSSWTMPLVTTAGTPALLIDGRWETNSPIPAGSTPVWRDYYLTPDNRLVTFDGNQVGTNIAKAGQVDRYTGSGTSSWTMPLATAGC